MLCEAEVVKACQQWNGLESSAYVLSIKQEPGECKAIAKQEKARGAKWPLDPPPVIELSIGDAKSQSHNTTYLHSPFWFCNVEIDIIAQNTPGVPPEKLLLGTTVSSLHKIKHSDNAGSSSQERGYFIFGDLNIRAAGTFRLKFSLFEMREGPDGMFAEHLGNTVHTKQFIVHSPKHGLNIRESTHLSKLLCDSGVKLRIRKEQVRRRSTQMDWSNHRAHMQQPGMFAGPVPAYAQHMVHVPANGEDISSRLKVRNNGLFDGQMMNADGPQIRVHDPGFNDQVHWPSAGAQDYGSYQDWGARPRLQYAAPMPTSSALNGYTSGTYQQSQYIPTTMAHGMASGIAMTMPADHGQVQPVPNVSYYNLNNYNHGSQVGSTDHLSGSFDQQPNMPQLRMPDYSGMSMHPNQTGQEPPPYSTAVSIPMYQGHASSQLPPSPPESEKHKAQQPNSHAANGLHQRF